MARGEGVGNNDDKDKLVSNRRPAFRVRPTVVDANVEHTIVEHRVSRSVIGVELDKALAGGLGAACDPVKDKKVARRRRTNSTAVRASCLLGGLRTWLAMLRWETSQPSCHSGISVFVDDMT